MADDIVEENMPRKIGKRWKPAQLGLAAHWDASVASSITKSGTEVSQWNDLSGNGHHLTQGTASDRPDTGISTINGKNAIDFNGNGIISDGGWMNITSPFDLIGKEVWAVITIRSHTTNNKLLGSSNPSNGQQVAFQPAGSNEGKLRIWQGGANPYSGDNKSTFAVKANSPNVCGFQHHTSTKKYVLNGTQDVTADTYTAGTMIPQFMGKGSFDPTLDALVGEVVVVEKELTLSERQLLEGYLAWKWGLQDKLPLTHPYRNDGTAFGFNTIWSPSELILTAWYDATADELITSPAGAVSAWNDKSGNGNDATQGTGTDQPLYITGSIGPALSFDGLDDNMLTGVVSATDQKTVFIVGKHDTLNDFMFGAAEFPASERFYVGTNGTGFVTAGIGNLGHQESTVNVSEHNVIALRCEDLLGELYVNGSQEVSTAYTNPATPAWQFALGAANGDGGGENVNGFGDCELSEVIIIEGLLSNTDLQKIEGYLAWKWGLMHKLPETHPYRYDGREFGYGVLWTPSQIKPDVYGWYDAADPSTITEAANQVSQWDDKSGKGNHLTQATGSKQPDTGVEEINGLNSLTFDNLTSEGMSNLNMDLPNTQEVFAVINKDTTDSAKALFTFRNLSLSKSFDDLGDGGYGFRSAWDGGGGTSGTNPGGILTGPHIVFLGYQGTDAYTYVDGVAEFNAGSAGTIAANEFRLCMNNFNGQTFDGQVGEFIILKGEANGNYQSRIEGYLAWKWGLVANLPASHPYKDAPPYV